ncbi:MAG TPA: beta family protein [Streptosporangiaceae bacterium]|nr:beta family protein [Streptosporangiaceae bacterium]
MAGYTPILKGRRAELLALGHADPAVAAVIRPLLEVIPAQPSLYGSVLTFGGLLADAAPKGMAFAVDCRYLGRPDSGPPGQNPVSLVAEHIQQRQIAMIPVFGLGDGANLAGVRVAAATHGAGGCLRLDREHGLQSIAAGRSSHASEVLTAVGLRAADVDLLIDLGEICTQAALQRAGGIARRALAWARRRGWRSITLASGAFPADIAGFPIGTSTPVPRWDAAFWAQTASHPIGGPAVGYGDYTVSSPRLVPGGCAPMPSLRHTGKRHWHVYRYPKSANGGMSTFCDLCRDVVCSGHWPPEGSGCCWGDEQIELHARRRQGPGNATSWRAFGTSHHLALVVSRLSALGEP